MLFIFLFLIIIAWFFLFESFYLALQTCLATSERQIHKFSNLQILKSSNLESKIPLVSSYFCLGSSHLAIGY